MKKTLLLSIFVALFISTGFDSASAQEETVTIDTLVTVDKDGKEIKKIIKKRIVRMEGGSGVDIEEMREGREKKRMLFIGNGKTADHNVILKKRGDGSEEHEVEIHLNGDGVSSMMSGSNENMIWIESDEDFVLGNSNSEILKMEVRSKSLAKEIQVESDAGAKARLEAELDTLLEEIFDLKLEKMEEKLSAKMKMLETERDNISARKSNKGQMILERKAKLLEEKKDKLRW